MQTIIPFGITINPFMNYNYNRYYPRQCNCQNQNYYSRQTTSTQAGSYWQSQIYSNSTSTERAGRFGVLGKSLFSNTVKKSHSTYQSGGYDIPDFTTQKTTKRKTSTATSGKAYSTEPEPQGASSSFWTKLKYNAKKGLKLAKQALNSAVGFVGYCATYVKSAIQKAGLGNYESGHAYNMVEILSKNKNFKSIDPKSVNLKSLPAGCIIVYGRGVAGYSQEYGHVEITTGTGTAVSDGITRNIRSNPTAVFIPV